MRKHFSDVTGEEIPPETRFFKISYYNNDLVDACLVVRDALPHEVASVISEIDFVGQLKDPALRIEIQHTRSTK